jgi:tRNA (adenine57-N1/adenine58-N1)-methyltransferase
MKSDMEQPASSRSAAEIPTSRDNPYPASRNPHQVLAPGEPVIFIDRKQRVYYDLLKPGYKTNIRGDMLPHDEIIGRREGFRMLSQREIPFLVFRPTLNDHVVNMPRGAQVIYPKDLGIMIQYADIYPGAKVVEAGLGSGALTTALLRAVGPTGHVISYEVRRDFIDNAKMNLRNFLGEAANHTIREVNIYEKFEDDNVDRLLLDLPEPWRVVHLVAPRMRPGAMICSYSPTIFQVKSFCESLRKQRCFVDLLTLETLLRRWNVEQMSVRPELRMVGHTAFLTFARKIDPASLPEPKSEKDVALQEESIDEDRLEVNERTKLDDDNS